MKYRGILYLLAFLFVASILSAQNIQVKNVRFRQSDDMIIINYDLVGQSNKKCTVEIEASDDYGRSFSLKPTAIAGDVGKDVMAGLGKTIRWDYLRDYPGGLEGEGFVFAVDAKLEKGSSKLPWFLLGAGIVGGGVYYLQQRQDKGTEENKGSIILKIPGEY